MNEGGKTDLLRCNVAISTFHLHRNYLLDSIWNIMINRIIIFMYYTPSCNVATQQLHGGWKKDSHRMLGGLENNHYLCTQYINKV